MTAAVAPGNSWLGPRGRCWLALALVFALPAISAAYATAILLD